MLQQHHFVNITHLFYSGAYEEGERQVAKILKRQTNNANLYVNHALFLSQLENDQQGLIQLEKAIRLNPRNYIAYFNVFSILTRMGEDQQAFFNLCCSLSCMYLIRARITKNLADVDLAILYASNNFQAHVLKGLILMQDEKYKQAKISFEHALDINTDSQVIQQLRKIAATKGNLQYDSDIIIPGAQIQYRLKSLYQLVDGCDIGQQIQQKLVQFNKLYVDINSNVGAVTQKVPNGSKLLQAKPSHIRSSRQNDAKIIYDSGLSTPLQRSQAHPQPGNIYIRSSIIQNEQKSFLTCKLQDNDFNESFTSIIPNEQPDKFQQKHLEQNMLINIKYEDQIQNLNKSKNNLQQFQQFQSMISQIKQQQKNENIEFQTQHYNIIYPLDDHMKLKINVLNLQMINKNLNYNDVYSIITYDKNKLKTSITKCLDGICQWNQQFQSIDITPNPSDMKIKIYNKKYTSFRDQFLGDLEVLITTADMLKLPLFRKQQIIGHLLLNLQLKQAIPIQNQTEQIISQ